MQKNKLAISSISIMVLVVLVLGGFLLRGDKGVVVTASDEDSNFVAVDESQKENTSLAEINSASLGASVVNRKDNPMMTVSEWSLDSVRFGNNSEWSDYGRGLVISTNGNGRLSGQAICNTFVGFISEDGSTFKVKDFGHTKINCDSSESQLLQILKTSEITFSENNVLVFNSDSGSLRFSR